LRHHRQQPRVVDLDWRERRAGGRRGVPPEAALRDAVAGLAAGHHRSRRAVGVGARTARPRCRGGDVMAETVAVAVAAPPIVTAEHVSKWYGQVIGLNDVSVSV